MELAISYEPIGSLKPYARNAKKHPKKQIEQIKKSIMDYGMIDPIGVWKNGEIIEGHGRYEACKQLGYVEVPVIHLDTLTDAQRREYMLVHNQTTLNSGYDDGLLKLETQELIGFDSDFYGFKQFDLFSDEEEEYDDDRPPAFQHNSFENQDMMMFPLTNEYGFPDIQPTYTVGDKFLRFMDWKDIDNHAEYIAHFYYDDYKFIAAWREPEKYLPLLQKFKAVVSPNFSLYTDFPKALQILSCYRRQWCGAFWQYNGIDVIPNVAWGDRSTYKWCFDGIPHGGTVSVSTVGVKQDPEWNGSKDTLFLDGYKAMMDVIQPSAILFYGDMIDGVEGNVIHIPSFYAEKREALNEKARAKHGNGEKSGRKSSE